jgi:hypothetical protein
MVAIVTTEAAGSDATNASVLDYQMKGCYVGCREIDMCCVVAMPFTMFLRNLSITRSMSNHVWSGGFRLWPLQPLITALP